MGRKGCASLSSGSHSTGLLAALQRTPQVVQDPLHSQPIQRCRQRQCLINFYSQPPCQKRQVVNREKTVSDSTATTLSSKTRELVETCDRPQPPKPVLHDLQVQDGDPRVYSHIPETRRMGNLDRPLRRIFTSPHPPSIKKVSQVPSQRHLLPVQQPTLRFVHSPTGLHLTSKGSKAASLKTRHQVTSVPGRLAHQSTFTFRIKETHGKTTHPSSNTGFHSKPAKIQTHSPAEVRFHRLPFCARSGSCQAHRRQMVQNSEGFQQNLPEICHQCKDSYVHHWITSVHRENSETRQDPHKTFSVASQDSLKIPNVSEFTCSLDSEDETTQGMVVEPTNVLRLKHRL